MLNELEEATARWRGPARDPGCLLTLEMLTRVKQFLRPSHLSDYALAYCAASACQHASPSDMVYWGTLCNERPQAAQDLAFGLFNPQRRPPLRIAHLLSQLDPQLRKKIMSEMIQHGLPRPIREAIIAGDVPSYVDRHARALRLPVGDREQLIAFFEYVNLPGRARALVTTVK